MARAIARRCIGGVGQSRVPGTMLSTRSKALVAIMIGVMVVVWLLAVTIMLRPDLLTPVIRSILDLIWGA